MRFLIDMNLSPEWGVLLQGAGYEAMHWTEVGTPDAPDEEILAYARERNWIVFTHDLDFGTLLAYTGADGPAWCNFASKTSIQ